MNINNLIDNVTIPASLIKTNELNLSNDEIICILRIKTIGENDVDLINFLEKFPMEKINVESLIAKKLIKLNEINSQIKINLLPLYESLVGHNQTPETNNSAISENQSALTISDIDRIKFILNRNIKVHELEKLKFWIKAGYEIAEIENAIHKSLLKNIDSFNYIEAVLYNEPINKEIEQTNDSQSVVINRNWEL